MKAEKTQIEIDIKKSVSHASETNPVRRTFWHMDKKVPGLVCGIQQGDDAAVIGKTVVNMEGPYPLKTGMKTGLIHTCSDIVIMGGKPLYAFDAMQVDSIKQSEEVAQALKKQADGLGVPLIGGNTQLENDLKPCVSFCIVGELVGKKIIPDSTSKAGDVIFMLGEAVEGETGQRVARAKTKFETYLDLIQKIDVHAAKDASRGGWFGNLLEMMIKAKKGFEITSIPYPRFSRYLGTYLVAISKKDTEKLMDVCAKHSCFVVPIGKVTAETSIKLGGKTLVKKQQMQKIIRESPYKGPNLQA